MKRNGGKKSTNIEIDAKKKERERGGGTVE